MPLTIRRFFHKGFNGLRQAFIIAWTDGDRHADTAYITGMRGYAALMVVFIHYCGKISSLPGAVQAVATHGRWGVVVFFVVSSYTICMTLDTHKRSYGDFLKRRFARIAPAYYVLLVVLFASGAHSYWGGYFQNGFNVFSLFLHLTFLNVLSYENQANAIGVEWTLPVEVFYYVFMPVLFVLSRTWRGMILVFLFGYVLSSCDEINRHFLTRPLEEGMAYNWSPARYAICFVAGILAYRIQMNFRGYAGRISGSMTTFLILLSTIAIVHFRVLPVLDDPVLSVSTATALFLVTGASNTRLSEIIFGNRIIVFIGTISYSLYLYHVPVIDYILDGKSLMINVAAFLLSIILAMLSYVYIERRFLRIMPVKKTVFS